MWRIFQAVVATGTTYVFAADTPEADARPYWLTAGTRSFVAADDDGGIVGMYRLTENRPALGSHVANASFMVAPNQQGRRIGEALCRDCLREAKRAGFLAMQFNFVVSTNERAVRLWQSLGFDTVGRLPRAFEHPRLGFVDALVMFRAL